jgi:hypothetical protein
MSDKTAPIFVVGSPRSGTSILTWCLGQHPNILPTAESNWIGRLALDLQAAYVLGSARGRLSQLSALGITRAAFFGQFGHSIDELIRSHRPAPLAPGRGEGLPGGQPFQPVRSADDPKGRWVDGTPEYSHYIYPLWQLFPQGRFIHILRDVSSVVKSMLRFSAVAGQDLVANEQAAYHYWLRSVRACVVAERALGSDIILRVKYADLVTSPERVLHRCLEFLGEPFCTDCLAPLGVQINSSKVPPGFEPFDPGTDPAVRREAEQLSRELLGEPEPCYKRDPAQVAEIERAFVKRSQYLARLDQETTRTLRRLTKAERELARLRDPSLAERVREAVRAATACDATILVISKGDEELVSLSGREGWHFPRDEHGHYAGNYPADSAQAISHLESLRTLGADYLLIPEPSFWWLDYYSEFARHLGQNYRRVPGWEGTCVLYDLNKAPDSP